MSKKIQNSKKFPSTTTQKHSLNLYLLLLIFTISILPLIVRMKTYSTGLTEYPWYGGTDVWADFFLYYKSLFFTFIAFFFALVLGWYFIRDRFMNSNHANPLKEHDKYKFTLALLPLGIYVALAFLSTIFSKHASFGFSGIFEQFESIFVLLGYCLAVYYAFIFVNTEEDIKQLLKWFLISILVLSLLGFTQALGHDFIASTLGKKLILPSSLWDNLDEMKFVFEKDRVYLSFYNPNYVGFYVALVVPILFTLSIFAKNLRLQIMYVIGILGLLLALIASFARNGFVALTVSFLFAVILL